jgi:hypothetical protein
MFSMKGLAYSAGFESNVSVVVQRTLPDSWRTEVRLLTTRAYAKAQKGPRFCP